MMTAHGRQILRYALPLYLALCLILGGASAAGVVANGALELIAVFIIASFAWRYVGSWATNAGSEKSRATRWLWALGWVTFAWFVIQLVPLPQSIWSHFGGRQIILDGQTILGTANVWRPLSMAPSATYAAAVWLLPFIAVLIMGLYADQATRMWCVYVIMGIAVLSSGIGVLQLGQGATSPFYMYAVTNSNASVGFFSNSNHLSTLFLVSLVFSTRVFRNRRGERRREFSYLAAELGCMMFFIINIFINRSLAGYLLLIPITFWYLLTFDTVVDWLEQRRLSRTTVLVAATLLGAGLAAALWRPVMSIAVGLTDPNTRLAYSANTLAVAKTVFPFGSGLGSFRSMYAANESLDGMNAVFVNHAHNDYVELLLEGSVFAVIIGILGLIWFFVARTDIARRRPIANGLADATAFILIIIALHSFVDYPARTIAISAVIALCMAVMTKPLKPLPRPRSRKPNL